MIILSLCCLFLLSSCDNTDMSPDNTQQTTDETNGNDNTSTDFDVCRHIFGEWSVVQNASCNEEGRRVRTCNTCSFAEEELIPKSEIHTPITDAAVPASCKNTGLTEGSHCSVCNEVLVAQTTVPKTEDHTPVVDAAVPASCKNTGLTEGSHCSVCNEVLVAQTTVPKTEDHTPVVDAAVPATCEDTGLTEGSHCSVCSKVLVERVTVSKLNHTYDQKKTSSEYIRSKATSSAAATYYYSCTCGSKGTTYFSYGSPLSEEAGWTSCNKTVYGIAQTYFYTKANSTSVCGTCKVGYAIQVVSTNGEWYKVSESNSYTNCVAYIKCSDVTDNSSIATFVKIADEYYVDATIKNQFTGAYLRNDISGSDASKVALINGSGYITVVSVNKTKTWAAIYYYGTDAQGRTYDGSKLYYCSLDEIEVLGLPTNWP